MKHFSHSIVLVFLFSYGTSFAQINWDDRYVAGCSVIYDSTNSVFRMWYCGGQGDLLGQIGYATSTDGINWQKYNNNPVLSEGPEGSWDHRAVGFPTVVIVNDTCHMWYAGVSDQIVVQIGYATSVDGIKWKKYENNPVIRTGNPGSWEDTWVYMPSVIYTESGFHIWYTGANGDPTDFMPWKEEIGYASSINGKTWTKHPSNPVFKINTPGNWDDSFVSGPSVLFQNAMFHLWYAGASTTQELWQIGYATSADGISWQRSEANPVLNPSGWENRRNQEPFVLFSDSTYHMWYSGGDLFTWQIGYATSLNGADWIKQSTPVVTDINETEKFTGPVEYMLLQNYPNPFNPSTTIDFQIPNSQFVSLKIYNILGEEVATLISKKLKAGSHTVRFHAGHLASGVYLYRLQAGEYAQIKKLVFLK